MFVYGVALMATNPADTNPVIKKPGTGKKAPEKPAAAKAQTAPKTSRAPTSKKHVVNAETARVLRDADAGKNLTYYADTDDLFRKRGMPTR